MVSFYRSKPPIKQNLIDLVQIETINTFTAMVLGVTFWDIMAFFFSQILPWWIFLLLAWINQFLIQGFWIWYPVAAVVRYLYVRNNNMSLFGEDVVDEDAIKYIRWGLYAMNLVLVLAMAALGLKPRSYHTYLGHANVPVPADRCFTALAILGQVLTLSLRLALVKAGRGPEAQTSATPSTAAVETSHQKSKEDFKKFVVLSLVVSIFIVLAYTVLARIFKGALQLIRISLFVVLPVLIILAYRDMRRHAWKEMKDATKKAKGMFLKKNQNVVCPLVNKKAESN